LKRVAFSVTGCDLPFSVSVPASDASLSPSKVKVSATKRAVGLTAMLNMRSPRRKPCSDAVAVLALARSIVMSALPLFVARSSITVPSFACSRPRCVDVPM
jgi:hypothetical protein